MINGGRFFETGKQLAEAAAGQTVETLRQAIATHGSASWVLAGGSTPAAAYRVIAAKHLRSIDWSKVTFIMGDERIAPLDSPDSNWHAAEGLLLKYIPEATFLRPASDQTAETAAASYDEALRGLPQVNGCPRFDLLWLGMGEDGHTLSLFPGHSGLRQNDALVIPIHDSPKPPADRITLSFAALKGVQQCMILVSGAGKVPVLKQIQAGGDFPVVAASKLPRNTTWLIDQVV